MVSVRRFLAAVWALLLGLVLAYAARAETVVDLELVLAVDVSFSMDPEEQRLQRLGYIQAFRDPSIIKAIQAGPNGRIAVTYLEWAGPTLQKVVLPWMLIDSAKAADEFAMRLAEQPITRWQRTSISAALIYAGRLFGTSQYRGIRRVIDISGDGPNNSGPPGGVTQVRDRLVEEGIVINGLPILLRPGGGGWGNFDISDLDVYYEECVIGGPGSFMIPIRQPGEFLTATRQKLLIEISDLMSKPRVQFAQAFGVPQQRANCGVGEQMWQRNWDFPR